MRARSLILFVLALGLGGGTAVLARSWLAQQAASRADAAPIVRIAAPTKDVLVARTMIVRGQILKADDFTWRSWPDSGVDENYIQSGKRAADSFAGWVARNALAPGEPLTEAKIVAPGDRGFLAAVLQPGMRAVSVPVTATSGISGFVFPGDRVDILITHPVPTKERNDQGANAAGHEHKACETVLRNVRVIGVDQKLEGKEGEAVVAHTATLEVTPKQSEMIAVAAEIGKLSLSLRSLATPPADQEATDSTADSGLGSFTLDSEVSRLLPKTLAQNENSGPTNVTILRGNGKAGETPASQPASRGL
jgi:pilus assembly protein CpaB